MIGLTRRQRELLTYIQRYMASRDGIAPSFEEMTKAMGLASKSGIHRLIEALVDRGHLQRLPNKARSITLGIPNDLEGFETGALLDELTRRGFEVSINSRKAA